jgi:transmembrane 9 superfamily member 2/4
VQEDYGWKLVWGEVFRPPRNVMPLSVLIGNGAQLTTMVGVTLGVFDYSPLHGYILLIMFLVFALLGFLSPSNRGSLATVMLICWTLFGL